MRHLALSHQIILAPAVIVVILVGLITWTLPQIEEMRSGIATIRNQGYSLEQLQIAMSSIGHLHETTDSLPGETKDETDELRFQYIEQAGLVREALQQSIHYDNLPGDDKQYIQSQIAKLELAEANAQATPLDANVLARLEEIRSDGALTKRSAYLNFYNKIDASAPMLINASLLVLLACIVLTVLLSVWSIRRICRRLGTIADHAREATGLPAEKNPNNRFTGNGDQLEQLDQHISTMTRRMANSIGSEMLLQGAESERRRIAMDIHDQILSELSSIRRKIDNLGIDTSSLNSDIDEAINNIRDVMDNLHPQVLDILGLEAALDSQLRKVAPKEDMPTYHLNVDKAIDKALGSDGRIQLYRIAVEAITNILRHSKCKRFEVNGRVNNNEIIFTIEDNGIGFDPNNTRSLGQGLKNIAYRANSLGAKLNWQRSRFSSGMLLSLQMQMQ